MPTKIKRQGCLTLPLHYFSAISPLWWLPKRTSYIYRPFGLAFLKSPSKPRNICQGFKLDLVTLTYLKKYPNIISPDCFHNLFHWFKKQNPAISRVKKIRYNVLNFWQLLCVTHNLLEGFSSHWYTHFSGLYLLLLPFFLIRLRKISFFEFI